MRKTRYEQRAIGGVTQVLYSFRSCQQQHRGSCVGGESWSRSQVFHSLLYQGVRELDFRAEGQLPRRFSDFP